MQDDDHSTKGQVSWTPDEKLSREQFGERYNQGKAALGLICGYAKQGLARVLMFGREKYTPWGWYLGLDMAECLESLERHMDALRRGEWIDPDSKLPHVDHIQANAMFASSYWHRGLWDTWTKDGGFPPSNETNSVGAVPRVVDNKT